MKLIFLTYVNRSGSTFLANKLSELPYVLVCPEAEILVYKFLLNPSQEFIYNIDTKIEIFEAIKTDKKLKFWNLNIEDLDKLKLAKTHFEAFFQILLTYKNKVNPKADIIIFKATKLIDLFKKISRVAKNKYNIEYISLVRDGRVSYASQRKTRDPFTNKFMNTNPLLAAQLWNNFISKTLMYSNEKNFFIVSYENLISNYKTYFAGLLTTLGVNKDELSKKIKPNDLYNRIPPDQKKIHPNVTDEANQEKIKKWKETLSPLQIYLFEKHSAENLLKMDYSLIHPKVGVKKLFFIEIYYRLKFLYWRLRHNCRKPKHF